MFFPALAVFIDSMTCGVKNFTYYCEFQAAEIIIKYYL